MTPHVVTRWPRWSAPRADPGHASSPPGRPEETSGRAGGSHEGVALEGISRVAAGRGAVRRANAVPVVAEEGCEQRPEGDAGQDEDRCDGHGSNSPPTENLPLVALMPT